MRIKAQNLVVIDSGIESISRFIEAAYVRTTLIQIPKNLDEVYTKN